MGRQGICINCSRDGTRCSKLRFARFYWRFWPFFISEVAKNHQVYLHLSFLFPVASFRLGKIYFKISASFPKVGHETLVMLFSSHVCVGECLGVLCFFLSVWVRLYSSVCVCVCMWVGVSVCECVCMYVWVWVCGLLPLWAGVLYLTGLVNRSWVPGFVFTFKSTFNLQAQLVDDVSAERGVKGCVP